MAIERVAVIGAGTMGAGIAQVCAQAGWTTALYDAFPEGLERGMQRIDAFWDKGIARGKLTSEQKEAWAKNLRAEADMKTAVHNVDLVIEAVPEIPELKAKVFAQTRRDGSGACNSWNQHILPIHSKHCSSNQPTRQGHRNAFLQSSSNHGTARIGSP